MDGVDEAEVVVGEEEGVSAGAKQAAGAAVDGGFAVGDGEETGEEVARGAVGGCEANEAVFGADTRVSRAVKSNQEASAECGVICVEVTAVKRERE